MSANLKFACERFVPGHPPQKAGEEFSLIADYCRENNFAADVYGAGELVNSFEKKVADLLGLDSLSYTEIYVGEGLLEIADDELKKTFLKLMEFSK